MIIDDLEKKIEEHIIEQGYTEFKPEQTTKINYTHKHYKNKKGDTISIPNKPYLKHMINHKVNYVSSHVCGLAGYNPMIDKPCPGCEERIK